MRWFWLGWLVVSSACSESPPQKQASAAPPAVTPIARDTVSPTIDTTAAAPDTAFGRCGVVLQAPSAEQRPVIEALKAAYGLEGTLFQHDALDTISRAEVYAHYRQGFSEQLAEQLTEYSWEPVGHVLRATDRALTVPESVGVLKLTQDHALVAWIPPTNFRRQWRTPRCEVDSMVREDGRWIVQGREP